MRILYVLLIICFYSQLSFAQRISVSGMVKDADGTPLPFVTVYLKSTNYGAVSDEAGRFEIPSVAKGSYQLSAAHIGFKTFEKHIEVTAKNVAEDIVLQTDATELSEVTVTREREAKQLEMKPISISSVEIKNVVSQNVLITDVVDRLSGVRIRRSSSLGENSDISINGMRGNAVRVYIDGLPMEFVYPNFDISTLPLSNLKRIDVYKGVLPVDVGTDALGGGINLVTEQKTYNSLNASYTIGSYNTHLADASLNLVNSKNYFLNVSGAFNYSDNNYGMNAQIFENNNRISRVRRFHDAYQFGFGGLSVGTHGKPWADELRLSLNFSGGFKELQNGARVSSIAIGEAIYHAKNISALLKYDKSFSNKVFFTTSLSYSDQRLNYVDTTRNVYSWSGKIVGRKNSDGEYSYNNSDTYYKSWVNRASITYQFAPDHKLLFSNLYANQELTGIDFLEPNPSEDYLREPQRLVKNVAGLQYEGIYLRRLTFSAALKRFDYLLDGAENYTFELVRKKDGIFGWNAALKYDIAEGLFARASYEKGYLVPLFSQFVGNGADIVRNTDLVPENSSNVNAGVTFSKLLNRDWHLATNVNGFYRLQKDIIFIGNGIIKQYENADEVRTTGVEGDVNVTFRNAFNLKTNVTFLRKTFTKVKVAESRFLVGTGFPNNPNFYANSELSWTRNHLFGHGDRLRAYIFYVYIAPFNHITVGQGNSIKNTPDSYVPVQHRVDAGLSYKFPKQNLTASFNALNVLNAELYDNYLVPRAGTNFNVKLIYALTNF